MDKNSEEKLIKSINKTGFPLELKVGNCFDKKDWNVSYNKYYLDDDERKGREIDIAAYKNKFCKNKPFHIGVYIIAEVKNSSKDRPWIIFSVDFRYYDFVRGYARMYYTTHCNLQSFLTTEEIEIESGFSGYDKLGKSYCEAVEDKEKEKPAKIFSALTATIKASEYIFARNKKIAESITPKEEKAINFFEPIIIFNGELYEAFLNNEEKISLKEVSRALVSFDYKSPAYQRFHYGVQIITFRELPNYLSEKEKWLESLSKIVEDKNGQPLKENTIRS